MAESIVLSGAQVKVYFGGTHLKEAQSISYTINYGEEPIYGVDSHFPQEIATTRAIVQGSCTMYYIQANGGLQGKDIRSRVQEMSYNPYVPLRIKDRKNDIDIFYCPQVKVTQQTVSVMAKGTVKVTFNFTGAIGYDSEDLN